MTGNERNHAGFVAVLSCCGKEDGYQGFSYINEAQAFRYAYLTGTGEPNGGHQRVAVIRQALPNEPVGYFEKPSGVIETNYIKGEWASSDASPVGTYVIQDSGPWEPPKAPVGSFFYTYPIQPTRPPPPETPKLEPKGHRFGWALKQMRKGRTVTRLRWGGSQTVVLAEDGFPAFIIIDNEEVENWVYELPAYDILSQDWALAGPPKRGNL